MSTATKWLLAVLVVFNLFLAALMSLLYGYRVSYKQELQQTAQELEQVQQQKEEKVSQLTARISALEEKTSSDSEQLISKEEEIKSLSQDLKNEQERVSELSGRNTDLNTQVQTLRDEKEQLETKVSDLNEELASKEDRISQLKERRDTISSRLAEVEANLRQKQVSLSEIQERYVATKSDLKDTEQHLAKYQEKYGLMGSTKMAPAVEGNVRAVNPEQNIVLINLGSQDGVQKGMRFSVVRGEKYVTEVEVVESYETWAAARSLEKYQKRAPEVGDVVTTINPAPEGNSGVSDETASSSQVPAGSAGGTTNISTSNSGE